MLTHSNHREQVVSLSQMAVRSAQAADQLEHAVQLRCRDLKVLSSTASADYMSALESVDIWEQEMMQTMHSIADEARLQLDRLSDRNAQELLTCTELHEAMLKELTSAREVLRRPELLCSSERFSPAVCAAVSTVCSLKPQLKRRFEAPERNWQLTCPSVTDIVPKLALSWTSSATGLGRPAVLSEESQQAKHRRS